MSARVKRRRREKQLERAMWKARHQQWRTSEEAVGYFALRRWSSRLCFEALQPVHPSYTITVHRIPIMG